MIHFTKIDYFKSGTDKQKQAYRILSENQILEKLKSFDPLLTGTISINIYILHPRPEHHLLLC
jgi:hypothetical protein